MVKHAKLSSVFLSLLYNRYEPVTGEGDRSKNMKVLDKLFSSADLDVDKAVNYYTASEQKVCYVTHARARAYNLHSAWHTYTFSLKKA